jgi:hypothetical protein
MRLREDKLFGKAELEENYSRRDNGHGFIEKSSLKPIDAGQDRFP